MHASPKRLSIIIASYNDLRICRAIESVRAFDDCKTVQLIVVDGASRSEVKHAILERLSRYDLFISEPDRGIFDALNKGLDCCQSDFIGWLGSDDRFTGQVRASDVIGALERYDMYIANVAFFAGDRVQRITYSLPAKWGLVKYGLHNPHYATFGRASLLKSERFDLDLQGADIDYFHKIFARRPRVATTGAIATLQAIGGYSNGSFWKLLRINWQLRNSYTKNTNSFVAPFLILVKLSYKFIVTLYFKVILVRTRQLERHDCPNQNIEPST